MRASTRISATILVVSVGLLGSVVFAQDLKLAPGDTVVVATPGVPKKLRFEIDPGGIRPLSPEGLIFGNTKQEYADQITMHLRESGFDLAACFSKELTSQLGAAGFPTRETPADHDSTLGIPDRLSRGQRPVVTDSEVLMDTVVEEYGFIVKKSERVRITMTVTAWLNRGGQSWRSPFLTLNPTQTMRLMRGTKRIDIPGLTTWKDRMEIEVNVADVAGGFTLACRELARSLVDEIPK